MMSLLMTVSVAKSITPLPLASVAETSPTSDQVLNQPGSEPIAVPSRSCRICSLVKAATDGAVV